MKRNASIALLTLTLSFSSLSAPMDGGWDETNDPARISQDFNYKFDELKLKAGLNKKNSTKAWSGSYWPDYRGGIARRSTMSKNSHPRHPDLKSKSIDFDYDSPTLETLKTMKAGELKKLSPAEKLDILAGRYHYPLVSEVYTRSRKGDAGWEGICHGWAPAALNHSEPVPVTLENADGVKIPFGASDIKGLLSYFYAYHAPDPAINIAKRCNSFLRWGEACKGINPGTLHVMLTNLIGERDQGFVIDITRGRQVWNQPLLGYESKIVKDDLPIRKRHEREGIARRVRLDTQLIYLVERGQSWKPITRRTKSLNVSYILELDENGEIIGGDWKSSERPDFAWLLPRQDFQASELLRTLEAVYNASMEKAEK